MPKCPHCGKILSDDWVKREGAALMGKASGRSKARSRAQAKAASRARWDHERDKKFEQLLEDARAAVAGVPPPPKKKSGT
jgi:hypothetical protein